MGGSKLLEFEHVPGRHCASTALADLMRFWGITLSESMCFGLGSGLNLVYLAAEDLSPTRSAHGRGPYLERDFFTNTGLPLRNNRQPDPEAAWLEVKTEIDSGRPVLLRNDLFYLDYYNARNHFSGHIVVLTGYDTEKGIAYLADTERPGIQQTSLESLARARSSSTPPFDIDNEYFAVNIESSELPIPLHGAVRRAMKTGSKYMLNPDLDFMGIPGIRMMAEQLPGWADVEDWKWCAIYAYQMIELRGTGGANFRNLYSEFVSQAALLLPELQDSDVVPLSRKIARKWRDLAVVFKRIADNEDNGLFTHAAEMVKDLAVLENELFSKLDDSIAE